MAYYGPFGVPTNGFLYPIETQKNGVVPHCFDQAELIWTKTGLSDVHQHQKQYKQKGPRLLQGVTQLNGNMEG